MLKNIDYTKYINYIIIAYAFLLPLSRAGLSILGFLMILLWFIQGDFKTKYNQLKDNSVVLSLVALILLGYISLIWTGLENIKEGIDVTTKIVRIIFLPMIVIATTLKKEYLPKVITAFLAGMLISEILSYGIFFELWTLSQGSGTPSDPTPFMHHLDYSTFLTFTSLLLLNRIFATDNFKLKVFYFIYFLFVTSNLFLNGGRTGHLAFAISIFVVGFVNIKNKFLAFFSMLFLVISIFYAAYNISPVFKQRFDAGANELNKIEANSGSKYAGSFGQRLGVWTMSIDIIKENPILGVGTGSIRDTITDATTTTTDKYFKSIRVGNMHNIYVEYLVMLGLIGLIFYLMIWYNLFKMKIKDKLYSNLKVIFIAVFCTASTVENLFHNQFSMNLFTLFVGIFIVLNLENKVKNYSMDIK